MNFFDGRLELLDDLVRQVLLLTDRLENVSLGPQELAQLVLEPRHLGRRNVVEVAVDPRVDRDDLLLHGPRLVLRLVQRLDHPLSPGQSPLRLRVELGPELRESLELAVLGELETQAPRHLLHRLRLGIPAHARDGDADVDGRSDARVEQVALQEDLTVRDRDDVRRDVGRDVAGLGLDHRQGGQRATAQVVRELAGALEEPGMEVEDVPGERLAPWRPPEEQRHLPVGVSVLREVVVDTERVLAVVEEVLPHRAAGEGSHPLDRSGLGRVRSDDDRVVHGSGFAQALVDLGDGRGLLADRHVDADHVLALLVQDRVDEDRGLAGGAVADHELALATTDRNHRVDRLDPGLERLLHGLAVDDAGRLELERARFGRVDRPGAVERLAERVHDPPYESVPDGHVDDLSGPLHGLAFADVLPLAEERHADVSLLEVEGDAGDAVLELEHLHGHAAFEPVHAGEPVSDLENGAHLRELGVDVVLLDPLLQDRGDLLWA